MHVLSGDWKLDGVTRQGSEHDGQAAAARHCSDTSTQVETAAHTCLTRETTFFRHHTMTSCTSVGILVAASLDGRSSLVCLARFMAPGFS
jgi:hypothetical protein